MHALHTCVPLCAYVRLCCQAVNSARGLRSLHWEHSQQPRCFLVHSLQQRRSALRAFHAAGPNSASGFATPHLKRHRRYAQGRRQGAEPFNPARGPLAVSLPYGSSLLSVGERGRAPCRRPTRPPKSPALYGVLCSPRFWPFFGSCGLRWVNMGQDRPQDGPT